MQATSILLDKDKDHSVQQAASHPHVPEAALQRAGVEGGLARADEVLQTLHVGAHLMPHQIHLRLQVRVHQPALTQLRADVPHFT